MFYNKITILSYLLICCCFNFSGCAYLSKKIIHTPNYGKTSLPPNEKLIKKANVFSVPSVDCIESRLDKSRIYFYSLMPKNKAPVGTCFLLHGYLKNSQGMLKFAESLVEAGFQTILVDSRGSGSSAGNTFTFGINESKDLTQILDHLDKNKLAKAPFFVTGFSYGASTAIIWGNQDSRIQYIIAVAPFSSFTFAVKHYVKLSFPLFWWMHRDSHIEKVSNKLGEIGGFDPRDLDLIRIVKNSKIKTLLLHGQKDFSILMQNSERLAEANKDYIKAKYYPKHGHNSIYKDKNREIRRLVTETLLEQTQ